MNIVRLRGILKNIQFSHEINGIRYDKADVVVKRENGIEDIIGLRFKSLSNKYRDDDYIDIIGNIRTFSYKKDNHNKVDVYVFTYFDDATENLYDRNNYATVDGRICKMNDLFETQAGKHSVRFILANNIITDSGLKLNSYIPCVAYGAQAKEMCKLPVGTRLLITTGELHSREFKKRVDNDYEIRVAHELMICDYQTLKD